MASRNSDNLFDDHVSPPPSPNLGLDAGRHSLSSLLLQQNPDDEDSHSEIPLRGSTPPVPIPRFSLAHNSPSATAGTSAAQLAPMNTAPARSARTGGPSSATAAPAQASPKRKREDKCEKCPICSIQYYAGEQTQHMRQFHSGPENVKCTRCECRFPTDAHRSVHERMVHDYSSVKRPRKWGVRAAKCCFCGRNFPSMAARERHIKATHPGRMRFACVHCSYDFEDREDLIAHQNSCRARAKLCCFCGKEFPSIAARDRHTDAEHPGRIRFSCMACSWEFQNRAGLEEHQRSCPGALELSSQAE